MNFKKFTLKLSMILIVLIACSSDSFAQNKTVKFEDITFDEAMAKAAKTHKIVFVDVTRAEPTKMELQVENDIFSIDSIARFFNDNCISIRVNMNSAEGKKFAPRLAMLMYPVYVFHDKTGDQLSFIGAAQILKDTSSLMDKARASLAIAKQKEVNTRRIAFTKSSWKEAMAKAKKENKLIFLDAYTTWCRPCIQMAKDVFTLDNVADLYNASFINVSMDMEKGDGPALVKKYKIMAYPDFLFIDGDGNLIHRGGGYQEAKEFINLGKAAIKAGKASVKR
jgi:thiol:disulfide interchange protein